MSRVVLPLLIVVGMANLLTAQGLDDFYKLGPDSLIQEGVPQGKLTGPHIVNIRGGHACTEKIRESNKKDVRVFFQDGRNDNRGQRRGGAYDEKWDWFKQHVRLVEAMTEKGYDINYSWGIELHGTKQGGAMLPEMMRWLWRDHGTNTDPNDSVERAFNAAVAK